MTKPNGYILYEGPSLIDHKPIVMIALLGSKNIKTGNMMQTYIIRSDIDPRLANKTGEDTSICGNCPMKGTPTNEPDRKQAKDRPCYVILGQGPLIVYNSYKAGKYPHAKDIASIGQDRVVRIGTYGDGSAVPKPIVDQLLSKSKGHTAYSHQSEVKQSGFDVNKYMISADSLGQAQKAWAKKHRTFRVIKDQKELDKNNEILCPASREAGQRTTCIDCRLCSGASIKAKSIAIIVHGAGKNTF